MGVDTIHLEPTLETIKEILFMALSIVRRELGNILLIMPVIVV